MADSAPPDGAADGRDDASSLPRHLSALIGSLQGPPDLGRNNDKYLTYLGHDESGGAESA